MDVTYLYHIYHPAALDAPKLKISFDARHKAESWLKKHKNDTQFIEWEVWRTKLGVSTEKYPARYLGDGEEFLKSLQKKPTTNMRGKKCKNKKPSKTQ